jgi:hypothetical protein
MVGARWGPAFRADAVSGRPLVGVGLHGGGDAHGLGRRKNETSAWVWGHERIRMQGLGGRGLIEKFTGPEGVQESVSLQIATTSPFSHQI